MQIALFFGSFWGRNRSRSPPLSIILVRTWRDGKESEFNLINLSDCSNLYWHAESGSGLSLFFLFYNCWSIRWFCSLRYIYKFTRYLWIEIVAMVIYYRGSSHNFNGTFELLHSSRLVSSPSWPVISCSQSRVNMSNVIVRLQQVQNGLPRTRRLSLLIECRGIKVIGIKDSTANNSRTLLLITKTGWQVVYFSQWENHRMIVYPN